MDKPAILLLLLAASFFAMGLADDPTAPPKGPLTDVVHSLLVGYICVLWCYGDLSRRRAIPPKMVGAGDTTRPETPPLWTALPRETTQMVLLILPIGIPLYLFHARPWRDALKGCGLAVLFSLLCFALSWLGMFIRLNTSGG